MNSDTLLILPVFAMIGVIIAGAVRSSYRHKFTVGEGFAGLLYHQGKLAETLTAGQHARWGKDFRLALVEMRKTLLQVPGQEVLTADNIAVKLSVVLTTQIMDAAKTMQTVDNHHLHLYSATQAALRSIIAGVTLDALLGQRSAIGPQFLELITPHAETVGVKVHSVDVRDVMLPGDLRKAFGDVLKARQEGLAALERARSESAALRNLANAARLVENQPALATLRFLQMLEGKSQTIVMNDLSMFTSASRTKPAPPAQE